MAVRIVTDSTADLPRDIVERLGIAVVPLYVAFGEQTYRDGVDLGPDRFYEMLAEASTLPRTSQPPVGDFLSAYERLVDEGADGIVSIHLSRRLSGTIDAANMARDALGGRCPVAVVDSQSVSMALGLVVIAAAEAAQAGAAFADVERAANDAVRRVDLIFLLDTLEYLQRGGRIGRAQALLGGILQLKPLLTIRDGEVHPLERVRTRARALERMVETVASYRDVTATAVADATTPADADLLAQRVQKLLPNARHFRARIGPVLGSHAGPGVLGVGVLRAS